MQISGFVICSNIVDKSYLVILSPLRKVGLGVDSAIVRSVGSLTSVGLFIGHIISWVPHLKCGLKLYFDFTKINYGYNYQLLVVQCVSYER